MLGPVAARKALAAVRIVNGGLALVVPEVLLERLGVDTERDPAGCYPFRMFGIRTVLIGADLLLLSGEELRRAERLALLIHACDTVSAAVTTLRGDLRLKHGLVATGISATNTGLAIAALRR